MSYPHNDDCTGVHTILTVRRTYNGGIKPGWTDVTEHRWCGDPAHVRRTLIHDRGWPRDLTKYRMELSGMCHSPHSVVQPSHFGGSW